MQSLNTRGFQRHFVYAARVGAYRLTRDVPLDAIRYEWRVVGFYNTGVVAARPAFSGVKDQIDQITLHSGLGGEEGGRDPILFWRMGWDGMSNVDRRSLGSGPGRWDWTGRKDKERQKGFSGENSQ